MRADEVPEGLVEKAMQAAYPIAPGQVEHYLAEQEYRDVLAAVLPEIQAQALTDAADEVSGYAWQPGDAPARVMTIEEQRAYMGGANDAHAIVDRLLRDRAVRLTTTTEGPTT